jgi:hypothetical protein
MQGDQPWVLRLEFRHRLGKRITQSLDHLEKRQIDVGNLFAKNVVAAPGITSENPFKVAEELGYSVGGEMRGALFGLVRLLLVVKGICDRMVRLACFI